MGRLSLALIFLGAFTLASGARAEDNSGRIYGTIYTTDGDVFKGLIRWDKNEGCWIDILDGTKELPDRDYGDDNSSRRRKYGERRSVSFFGVRIRGDVEFSSSAQSGIRFGHIKQLEVIDDDRALLMLKSGEEVEFKDGSTDIGTGIREIVIEDPDEGEVEFVWDDIERIEFASATGNIKTSFGDRLYGTVTTRRGDEFTGFICWDVDELFANDVLDGDEKRRSRKIKFGTISSIERYGSSGAQVVMSDGDELLLRNSNDVDNSNRGIIISDPGFGQVQIAWDEFEKVEFKKSPALVRYDDFDGGRKLHGTVYTEDGEKYNGEIVWDYDEAYTWEILNGSYRDNEYDIELGLVKIIEKNSHRSSTVTVRDGRTFRLRGSNDVDDDNKGILIISENGDEIYVEWDDFKRVEFD